MPPPLAPQHYAQRLSQPRRSAFSIGGVTQLLRAVIFLALFAAVVAIGWWYYTLQYYPQERVLWTADGRTIHAEVIGRTDTLFNYQQKSDAGEYFIPIAALSEWDQLMTKLMPVNTTITYPVDCTLRDANGRTVSARIQGHDQDTVTFTLQDSRGTFNYPFAKLSPQDQAWIQLLPNFEPPAPVPVNATVVVPSFMIPIRSMWRNSRTGLDNYSRIFAASRRIMRTQSTGQRSGKCTRTGPRMMRRRFFSLKRDRSHPAGAESQLA